MLTHSKFNYYNSGSYEVAKLLMVLKDNAVNFNLLTFGNLKHSQSYKYFYLSIMPCPTIYNYSNNGKLDWVTNLRSVNLTSFRLSFLRVWIFKTGNELMFLFPSKIND